MRANKQNRLHSGHQKFHALSKLLAFCYINFLSFICADFPLLLPLAFGFLLFSTAEKIRSRYSSFNDDYANATDTSQCIKQLADGHDKAE
ncbi:MAG: hypothetical protein NWF09_01700 [Candidatus Bathyarchaeota archaeon]|nr:hypothetical protein [Candidatus Bathyarchaeota archaeon]